MSCATRAQSTGLPGGIRQPAFPALSFPARTRLHTSRGCTKKAGRPGGRVHGSRDASAPPLSVAAGALPRPGRQPPSCAHTGRSGNARNTRAFTPFPVTVNRRFSGACRTIVRRGRSDGRSDDRHLSTPGPGRARRDVACDSGFGLEPGAGGLIALRQRQFPGRVAARVGRSHRDSRNRGDRQSPMRAWPRAAAAALRTGAGRYRNAET
jgi:hypothetical protein